MRHITREERRTRLGVRHFLAAPGPDVPEVAGRLIGLHATDPASVYLAARARLAASTDTLTVVERALYEERSVVRMLGMRRTMWVVPTPLVPVVYAGATRTIGERNRKRLLGMLERPAEWLADLEANVLRALEKRSSATGAELSSDVPDLRTKIVYAEDKAYGGPVNITSQVLNLMSMDGHIVRGRPRGTWLSSQYAWASLAQWTGTELVEPVKADAQADLIGRWLYAFGPATLDDIKWWTGFNAGEVKRALASIGPVEVSLDDGATGLVHPDDEAPVEATEPWVAFLPALDPTAMGWKERDWYVTAEQRAQLFDRMGNIGPTVWCDGRIVGGWAQDPDGVVVHRLLEKVGRARTKEIDAEAARLTEWFGDSRPIPRFRTPLERELSS